MTKKVKIGIGVAAAAVLVLFLVVGIIAAQSQNAAAGNIPRSGVVVEIEEAHRETIVTKVSAKGTASLINQTVVYAEASGQIGEVTVKVGDAVTAGQVLATYAEESLQDLGDSLRNAELTLQSAQINLSNASLPSSETEILQSEQSVRSAEKTITDLEAQIEQTDISLDQLRRNLERTQSTHNKNQTLYDQGLISLNDLEASEDAVTKLQDQIDTTTSQRQTQAQSLTNAKDSLSVAQKQHTTVVNRTSDAKVQNQIELQQVQVEQAQQQVDKLRKDYDDLSGAVLSPINGVVLAVSVTEGEVAQEGRAIFTIADTTNKNLVLTVYIPEGEAKEIALGQKTEITGGALGSTVYEGELSKVYPVAEMRPIGASQETAITVEVSCTDETMPMKAGYTVDTKIITNTAADVVVVPLMSVVTSSDDESYVFVVLDDYTVEKRDVAMKNYANLYVEVEGINEGEKVVVNPPNDLEAGTAVRPAY